MTEKEIIKQLNSFRGVGPSEEYITSGKRDLFTAMEGMSLSMGLPGRNVFSQSLGATLSLAFAAVFIMVLTFGGIAGTFRTLLLPPLQGVANKNVVAEANSISTDIDIRLREIEYFEVNRDTVALARPAVVSSGLNLSSEAPTEDKSQTDKEIDRLLDEAIGY